MDFGFYKTAPNCEKTFYHELMEETYEANETEEFSGIQLQTRKENVLFWLKTGT